MARRDLLTGDERRVLFGVPLDRASLAKFYTVMPEYRAVIEARCGDANRLGFALHLALLQYPGFGLRHDEVVPDFLVRHIAEQLGLRSGAMADYARRAQTRLEHGWDAMGSLGLRGFEPGDVGRALDVATEAASGTERGMAIGTAIVDDLRTGRIVLPAPARIERIGIAGRARARKRFDAYLLPRPDAAVIAADLPFDTDVDRYLDGRAKLLDWRLRRFGNALRRGTLDGVELKAGELRVAPLSATTPAAADQLDASVDRLMPKVRITELWTRWRGARLHVSLPRTPLRTGPPRS